MDHCIRNNSTLLSVAKLIIQFTAIRNNEHDTRRVILIGTTSICFIFNNGDDLPLKPIKANLSMCKKHYQQLQR